MKKGKKEVVPIQTLMWICPECKTLKNEGQDKRTRSLTSFVIRLSSVPLQAVLSPECEELCDWETAPSHPTQPTLFALSHKWSAISEDFKQRSLFLTAVRESAVEAIFPSFHHRSLYDTLGGFVPLLWRVASALSIMERGDAQDVHVSPLKMLVTLQPYKDPNGVYTITEDLWVRNQIPNWKYVPVDSVFPLPAESATH